MGVLDDAIREHLDLKRRHGVAEEELLRQEEEALGPARREVAPDADSDDGESTGEAPPQPVDGHEPAELPVDEAVEEAPAADTPPQGLEALADEEPVHDEEELAADEEELPHDDALPAAEEELPAEEEPHADEEPHAADESFEEEDGDPSGEDPDLLEDTPDFLQETPEHDRLWFEQKPPRDFDFD